MITIVPYRAGWPDEFERIRTHLQETLNERALRIDHIGSTAVPGLAAKDIVDIQVTVGHFDNALVETLQQAGYRYLDADAYQCDHVPAGEPEARDLWEKRLFTERSGQRRAHIHIRRAGNPNQRYALLFRDYLRVTPASAASIAKIKQELAKRFAEDTVSYYDIKDPVYDLVWEAAKAWAEVTGWNTMDATAHLR